jgi:hypothetical protein
VKGISTQLAMDDFVTMVQYFQTFGCPNGKIQESEERYSNDWLYCRGLPIILVVGEFVPVRAKGNQVLEIVRTWSLEYASNERFLSRLCRQSDKLYWAKKVLAFWIRLLYNELGELEFAL